MFIQHKINVRSQFLKDGKPTTVKNFVKLYIAKSVHVTLIKTLFISKFP